MKNALTVSYLVKWKARKHLATLRVTVRVCVLHVGLQ